MTGELIKRGSRRKGCAVLAWSRWSGQWGDHRLPRNSTYTASTDDGRTSSTAQAATTLASTRAVTGASNAWPRAIARARGHNPPSPHCDSLRCVAAHSVPSMMRRCQPRRSASADQA